MALQIEGIVDGGEQWNCSGNVEFIVGDIVSRGWNVVDLMFDWNSYIEARTLRLFLIWDDYRSWDSQEERGGRERYIKSHPVCKR